MNASAGHDPAMQQAIDRAQRSFPYFWRELSWENRRVIPGLDFAAIKLPFPVSEDIQRRADAPAFEHMWVTAVEFDGHELKGTLMNDAHFIPALRVDVEVSAPFDHLEDWMMVCQGVLCGGFTVQHIRASMFDAERKEHDEAWGQPFPDPQLCNITPYEVKAEAPAKGLSRLWRKATPPPGLPFDEAMRLAAASEHPMSENMHERITEDLQEQPEMARTVFDDGWTLLQRDALGGNVVPVAALLAAGADREARTPAGDTALDLAKRMGWPRVIAALQG